MSYVTDITAAIAGMDKWQRVALAAMCAASVSPVIKRFGQPATRRAFEVGLDVAWASARDGAAGPLVVAARTALESLHESNCDDANLPAHNVMAAMSILSYALSTIIENDSERWAKYACTESEGCYSGYDQVLTHGSQVRTIDPRNPPPPGHLESLQIQAQLRSIEAIRGIAAPSNQIINQLRASAGELASELDRVLPLYAERRGWRL